MTAKTVLCMGVDGVLVTEDGGKAGMRRRWDVNLQKDLGLDPEILSRYFFRGVFRDVLEGKQGLIPALQESLREMQYDGSAEDVVAYWFRRDAYVDPNLLEYVAELRQKSGMQMYLAANQEHMRASYLWNKAGLCQYFDGMFYSAKIGCTKEDMEFFAAVRRHLALDVTKDTILFFDNNEENIRVAKAAGWAGFLYETAADFASNPHIRLLIQGKAEAHAL